MTSKCWSDPASHWQYALLAISLAVGAAHGQAPDRAIAPIRILGAADRQIRFVASAAQFESSITVESTLGKEVDGVVRISPFRNAAGESYAVKAVADTGTLVSQPNARYRTADSIPIRLDPEGSVDVKIQTTLPTEGEYTAEIRLISGKWSDTTRITVTRAVQDLGVEIQGVDSVEGTASVVAPSTSVWRFVVVEKLGRAVTLNPMVLSKLTRRGAGGGRSQTPYQLTIGGQPPTALALTPNQSLPVALVVTNLEGAGDYQGTVRISAAGTKPVDHDFSTTLKDPRWMALVCILLGIGVSAVLQSLSQKFRPLLVETRRALLIIRDLNELLSDPSRLPEEGETLRTLRRQAASAQADLEVLPIESVRSRLNQMEERRMLALEWIARRRQVSALEPDTLRGRFLPVVDSARDVALSETSTIDQIKAEQKSLVGLNAEIDTALRGELSARIDRLRKSLDSVSSARPTSQLAALAPATVHPPLDAAEREANHGNLRVALASYNVAQRGWTSLLLDDLAAALADEGVPFGLTTDEWTNLKGRMQATLGQARDLLSDNPDASIQRYEVAWMQYAATVGDGLRRKLVEMRDKVEQNIEIGEDQRKTALANIGEAQEANADSRAAAAQGKTQEVVASVARAIELAQAAERSSERRTRGSLVAPWTCLPAVVDAPPMLIDARGREFTTAHVRTLATATAAITRIDWLVLVVAILVSTLLGLTVLWSPNATWGGWDDRIVAVLWGLGLHQFTFTGFAALSDRLRGTQSAGGPS